MLVFIVGVCTVISLKGPITHVMTKHFSDVIIDGHILFTWTYTRYFTIHGNNITED